MTSDSARTPNRLIDEPSPYLQQHAHNPVDWYPWSEEAFARARAEDRPIFLSIGYSTCHWCHVMEHESFEDEETASLMNRLFVNIKVDREERPDVDHVYMTAAQAINGTGGWPLSAWLTPELKPFYVGTYFPPRPAFGRPSFQDALRSLHHAWTNEREKVNRTAIAIMRAVEKGAVVTAPAGAPVAADPVVQRCLEQLEHGYDPVHGGFNRAPKFPRPSIFEFLLRHHAVYGTPQALNMTLHTLDRMASGGMYDQLGGGFARYSVDAEWRVPHFEKMLYDEGQLLAVYADAYRVTRSPRLADVMVHTVAYLERDLMHPSGVFYSAEDADSEGEEGTFYVWTLRELGALLSAEELDVVRQYYGITADGNFEHGRNVLYVSDDLERVAARMKVASDDVVRILASARAKMFESRCRRVRPHRDEKVLTGWNGLVIAGLARCGMALDNAHCTALARRAADGILSTMRIDGRLMHRMKDGEIGIDGYLDDYAFLAAGLLDLYDATGVVHYLREAERLVREALQLFLDEDGGGFFMTSGHAADVLVRAKSDHDGAEPSGNSVMAMNLTRLGNLFHDEELAAVARRTISLFIGRVAEHPIMMPLMTAAAIDAAEPPRQTVVVAGDDAAESQALLRSARAVYRPGAALVVIDANGPDEWLAERIDGLRDMRPVDGHAAAYVCENFTCRAPVTSL